MHSYVRLLGVTGLAVTVALLVIAQFRHGLIAHPGRTLQISGRSDLSWEESVKVDLYYAENWSLIHNPGGLSGTHSEALRRADSITQLSQGTQLTDLRTNE